MRRFFAFGVAWLAAAVVATVVAWQGVGLIGDQVTDKQSSTLSAAQIDAALAGSSTTEAPGRSSTSGRPPTTTAAPGPAATGPGTAGGGGAPAGTQPSGGDGPGATTAAPGPAATSPAPEPARPITRTYHLNGGTVTISFSPTAVRLVSGVPNPGYALTRSGPGDNNGWRVEFEGPGGRSRIDAWWAGGPQRRIDENPSGGGSGKGSPG
ncbi:MAG TPA: hypothetical protein VKB57_28230 [Acidimicrobiales bacterium]|nr:hypothetical protein [Acidimicrobiales bacterium]